jgi:hypothetical protein
VANGKNYLLFIQCRCGYEFLLLPDVQIMGNAIEKHALEHKKKYGLTQEQTECLKDYLIDQAFKLASRSQQQNFKKT